MTPVPPTRSGLVAVSVASGTRRVDLVLPAAVPVAELVPELARSVGLLDAATVHGGYRLVAQDGRELAGDVGLTRQGVRDGGLLTVAAGVDDAGPRVYDDVVEAMSDAVERDLEPWERAATRRAGVGAAGLLMLLGAGGLVVEDSSAAAAAAVVALGLVAGAIVLSRAQHEPGLAVAVAWWGAGYAAVAGFALAPDGTGAAQPVATSGGGALLAGLVALVGLGAARTLLIPPVVVGGVLLATGLALEAPAFDPAVALTAALAIVVLTGSALPWLALGVTGTTVDRLCSTGDRSAEPADIDLDRVRADAGLAHEILVAVSATVGLLLVVVAPFAVSRGVSGALLALMCCLVVVLRTRQHHDGRQVLVGVVSGVLGLSSAALAALWLHPTWRPTAALLLATLGVVTLAATLLPPQPSARRQRLADLAESVSLLSLLPLLAMASGLVSAVRA